MYLTLDEFKNMGYKLNDETKFADLETSAGNMINQLTSFYDPDFNDNNLDIDLTSKFTPFVKRAKAFKKAVAQQIEFMDQAGVSNAYEIASQGVNSFTVGHTSMNLGSNAVKDITVDNTGVCKTAYDILARYGFLYDGVDHQ